MEKLSVVMLVAMVIGAGSLLDVEQVTNPARAVCAVPRVELLISAVLLGVNSAFSLVFSMVTVASVRSGFPAPDFTCAAGHIFL